MTENDLAKLVFECDLQVHKTLGPGLLEVLAKNVCFMSLRSTMFG